MEIRHTQMSELDAVMGIYQHAREFMAATGNPHQWGDSAWPWREVVEEDISSGKSYVLVHKGKLAAVFFYDFGTNIEPDYQEIEGAWIGDTTYGVVHRIASAHLVKGAGRACIQWALEQSGHVRIDTHEKNLPMIGMLTSLGFTCCGTIYISVRDTREARLAFEAMLKREHSS